MNPKVLPVILGVLGAAAVSYGMIGENHMVFLLGLLFIIGAYLIIRKKLKESIRDSSSKMEPMLRERTEKNGHD